MTSPTPRRFRADGDTGSMAMYLTIAIVGLAIAALLVPMVITSSRITRSDTSRAHALDAAQAGINVMTGGIRAAQTGGVGISRSLPCGPITGRVNSVGAAAYSVSVSYFTSDPATLPAPTPMQCTAAGPYTAGTVTPGFARITSMGTDGTAANGSTAGRTLETTYVFRTTSTNIAGGTIKIYSASGTAPGMCMDAGMAPAAATRVKLAPCTNPQQDRQVFAYSSDLTLQLVSSKSATYRFGLCLDTARPVTVNNQVFLGECADPALPANYQQQWSYNDQGGYTASLPTSATLGTLSPQCIAVANQNLNAQLLLAPCGNTSVSPTQSWDPSPAVGPGGAASPQLVNFGEFGRCVDVPSFGLTGDHLNAYPCKQNPFRAGIEWNQKFTKPEVAGVATSAVGQIYTTPTSTRYCLTSPNTEAGYVTITPCSDTNTRQRWTVYGGTSALPYSAKFTIVDSGSRCLGLNPVPASGDRWSPIDVETCTGAKDQKWNAPAILSASVLRGLKELP